MTSKSRQLRAAPEPWIREFRVQRPLASPLGRATGFLSRAEIISLGDYIGLGGAGTTSQEVAQLTRGSPPGRPTKTQKATETVALKLFFRVHKRPKRRVVFPASQPGKGGRSPAWPANPVPEFPRTGSPRPKVRRFRCRHRRARCPSPHRPLSRP